MFDFSLQGYVFVTCAGGVEPVLERELRGLGYKPESVKRLGVAVRGSLDDCLRMNLHLRTAHRVLYELHRFKAYNADELYVKLKELSWEKIIAEDGYLTVASSVDNPSIRDARFANQRVKDAVVDRISEEKGSRPNSGPERSGVVLFLHWRGQDVSIYLDTSGEPLSNRGYRTMPHKAPLRESISAATLLEAGFDGKGNLVNPMCGSGTLAIEGALIATNTAPGLLRVNFAFQSILGFDSERWEELRAEARGRIRGSIGGEITASDHDPEAVEAARSNAKNAGMDEHISIRIRDFTDAEVPDPKRRVRNVMAVNPEYGKRLGDEEKLERVYSYLGDFMKKRCRGYTGAVFTGNRRLAKCIGLRTKARIPMMNGPLECRVLLFELYAGSKKA